MVTSGGFEAPAGYRISRVARPSSMPMLTTSVAVVRKMLEAVGGGCGTGARALLEKHAGKFKAVKFNRADLYDRACLR